jgi:hypothetical protein
MAMAGQGLNAAPPPRPPSHNHFGAQNNPGNQLYVGNVSFSLQFLVLDHIDKFHTLSFLIKLGGRI